MAHVLNYIKTNKWLLLIIIPAFLFHLLVIFPSGTYLCVEGRCGLYFVGVHGHDAIWHLALANKAFSTLPFNLPIYAGAHLGGYNYLMDIVMWLMRFIGISAIISYFKVLPIIWFIAMVYSSIRLSKLINKSALYTGVLLFFFFFGGSLSYLLAIAHTHSLWGASGILAMQAGQTLTNLQFAFSLIFIIETLIILKKKKWDYKDILLLGLFAFITLGLKFYAGVITTFLIGIFFFCRLCMKDIRTSLLTFFSIGMGAAAALLLFYDPFSSVKTGSIFTFAPLSTVHPIIEDKQLFYSARLTNARYMLQSLGVGPRLILIELYTLTLFLIGNYGLRVIGVLYVGAVGVKRKLSTWELSVFLTIIFATLLNILFVQKGEWWNTVQFLYYGIFLSNIFTASVVYYLLKQKKILLSVLAIAIMILSFPNNIDIVHQFTRIESMVYIPEQELQALDFLKKQPKGIVMQPAFLTKASVPSYPKPLYSEYDSAYIPAFSFQQENISDIVQLKLTGIDYERRLSMIKEENCDAFDNIDYIYIISKDGSRFLNRCMKERNLDVKKIYSNKLVDIFKRGGIKVE